MIKTATLPRGLPEDDNQARRRSLIALMSCAKSRTLPAINSKALPTFKRFN
jgi:hypothetical protein